MNTLPTASITPSGNTTFCVGNSVTLTSSAGTGYLWSNGGTSASILVNTAGSYTVTVTNGNNCSAVSSPEIITINPLPVATITASGPTTFCSGGFVTLTSSTGTGGATTLNIPDTVGYTMPDEFGALIAGIIKNTPGASEVVISVHCHDDLGLAVANSVAGLRAGARQAECTVNGIGERAGNASLEEIVMALRTRADKIGLKTGIDATQLCRVSKLVSRSTSYPVPPNKAIVGGNAFAHESGIHQDGMIKNAQTYEIMRPEDVGAAQTMLVLGKHSGRNAFSKRLAELGYALEGDALLKAFNEFKKLADRKKAVHDADLITLASDERAMAPELWALENLQVVCGTTGQPTATVSLRGPDGKLSVQTFVGTGPVDATYKAIDAIVKLPVKLIEFGISSVTEGIDALAEASVRVRHEEQRSSHGHGADTDIVVASAKAYIAAINQVLSRQASGRAQHPQNNTTVPEVLK